MSKIKTEGNYIQVKIINQLVKTKLVKNSDPAEYEEVIFKELFTKKWFRRDGITTIEEYITTKKTIAKTRSTIFDTFTGRLYVVNHTIEEVEEAVILKPITNKIGYICH